MKNIISDKKKSDNRFFKHDYPLLFPTLKHERAHCKFLRGVYNNNFSKSIFKL